MNSRSVRSLTPINSSLFTLQSSLPDQMPLLSALPCPPSASSFPPSTLNTCPPAQSNSLRSVQMTRTRFTRAAAARCPYQLKEGQERHFHRLPSGLKLEVIQQKPPAEVEKEWKGASPPVPVVLVHGSFHAAWCWAEHWMPFLSGAGLHCYAVSLLGQGESDVPEGTAAGTLEDEIVDLVPKGRSLFIRRSFFGQLISNLTHTSDVADFISKEISAPPILIGHSFGGLNIQSYLSAAVNSSVETSTMYPKPAGAILLCSVPPSGNSGLVWRYLLTKPIAAVKVTLSLAAKAFANSLSLCKETFFSSGMEDHLVLRYQELMKASSQTPLFDLRRLNASLPVASIPKDSLDILVLGASNDFIVDMEGLNETAKFYGVEPVCVEGVAHDMMLDCAWEKGAQVILSWIRNLRETESS